MPLIATRGAASAQGFGEFAQTAVATYIEDVFSTYLYPGQSSGTITINNGIDLSGEGGLVWTKNRSVTSSNSLIDTVRGVDKQLISNNTGAQTTEGYFSSFTSTGYTIPGGYGQVSANSQNFVSWTFRKQPKFFDVVTYTGNGGTQSISHNLGSSPGCIIIKAYSAVSSNANWIVWHRSLPTSAGYLNTTDAFGGGEYTYNLGAPTSTTFTVVKNGAFASATNDSGISYVAYLFAHNAGGFGLTGDQNVISCGSADFSTTSTINLGYEPQWMMFKRTDSTSDWRIVDNMRGWPVSGNPQELEANTSDAEASNGGVNITNTGFSQVISSGTWIYIAIRRGPMKTPTSGTSVFSPPVFATGSSATRNVTTNTVVDLNISRMRARFSSAAITGAAWSARLTGASPYMFSSSSNGESTQTDGFTSFASNTGYSLGADTSVQAWNYDNNYAQWTFSRAPGFFDVVCYTGNDNNRTISHNLGAVPEMMIVKCRDSALDWAVYHSAIGNTKYLWLNSTAAETTASTYWNNTTPTSSVFTVGTSNKVNSSPSPYIAYLFASCPGVSKVGSYTGTGTTLQVNCGFTAGSRFVMIKRADDIGDWYVWDSVRGINVNNDPYLLLNTATAEVTNTDYVDSYSAGFELSSTAPAALNANGGTYIFLAIA